MTNPERLSAGTAGFALSAAITILFNTALACAKDIYAPLNGFMKSITGHHWTTHGLVDLILFLGLGFLFANSRIARALNTDRIVLLLSGSVLFAGLSLGIWYLAFGL